jgi:hypothetical protein
MGQCCGLPLVRVGCSQKFHLRVPTTKVELLRN